MRAMQTIKTRRRDQPKTPKASPSVRGRRPKNEAWWQRALFFRPSGDGPTAMLSHLRRVPTCHGPTAMLTHLRRVSTADRRFCMIERG
jgi:hypothetical protein